MCPLNIGEDSAGRNFGVGSVGRNFGLDGVDGVGQKNNMGKCFTI